VSSSTLFCATCGAANNLQAAACFACGQSLTAPPVSEQAAPQRLLKQRYLLIGQIGQGGFGAVYKAADTGFNNRLVAVKEASQNGNGMHEQEPLSAIEAFKQEAQMLAGLMHPNLPRIYDHFSEEKHWYLVMDFIEGETLEDYLAKAPDGRLPLKEVLAIGMQLCTVLDYLHTRQPPIIFRDLKPSNVMRTTDGQLYLIDFGIARHFKPGQLKDTIAFGSPGYAAPEQYGKAQTSSSADIYSLGAILHQMLTGVDPSITPFTFDPLHLYGYSTLLELEVLLLHMVEINARKRLSSVTEVRRRLQRISEIARHHTAPLSYQLTPTDHVLVSPSNPVLTPSSITSKIEKTGYIYGIYQGHSQSITTVAWSPDGTRIASGSEDTRVHVWEPAMGSEETTFFGHSGYQHAVKDVVWSPDSTLIASCGAGSDTTVQVWDAQTAGQMFIYTGHRRMVNALTWSPDGAYIASGSDDSTVQIWEPTTGDRVFTYLGDRRTFWETLAWYTNKRQIYALAWSPDGTRIVLGGGNGFVQVWHVLTRRVICSHRPHAMDIVALTWSPGGTYVASGSKDGTVKVWEAATGNLIFTYHGHAYSGEWVTSVAWSPDGKRIASAGKGGTTVQIWDAHNGGNGFTYRNHTDNVNTLAWSPDGTRIASGSDDKTVHIWQAI